MSTPDCVYVYLCIFLSLSLSLSLSLCVCVCDVAGNTCAEPYTCMLYIRCLSAGSAVIGIHVCLSVRLSRSLSLLVRVYIHTS